jgi:hypothetical protein
VWRLSPRGAVRRLPWEEGMDRPPFEPVPHRELSDRQRRTKALRYAQQLPALTPEFLVGTDSAYLRTLRDLVQDKAIEDAILRMVQVGQQS